MNEYIEWVSRSLKSTGKKTMVKWRITGVEVISFHSKANAALPGVWHWKKREKKLCVTEEWVGRKWFTMNKRIFFSCLVRLSWIKEILIDLYQKSLQRKRNNGNIYLEVTMLHNVNLSRPCFKSVYAIALWVSTFSTKLQHKLYIKEGMFKIVFTYKYNTHYSISLYHKCCFSFYFIFVCSKE